MALKNVPILPTLVTLGNAVCGFIAINYVMQARFDPARFDYCIRWAGWMILFAMIFDALDGKVARLSHSTSDFGAELDSLCDIISFGVAPALIVQALSAYQGNYPLQVGWAASILFVLCVALRLARFNVETDSSEESHKYFKGLPCPAAAGFIAALTINIYDLREEAGSGHEFGRIAKALLPIMDSLLYVIPIAAIVLAVLMVSRVRYVHVLNKLFRSQEPVDYLVKLILVAILLVLTRPFSLPLIVGGYVCSGVIVWMKELILPRAAPRPGPPSPPAA